MLTFYRVFNLLLFNYYLFIFAYADFCINIVGHTLYITTNFVPIWFILPYFHKIFLQPLQKPSSMTLCHYSTRHHCRKNASISADNCLCVCRGNKANVCDMSRFRPNQVLRYAKPLRGVELGILKHQKHWL